MRRTMWAAALLLGMTGALIITPEAFAQRRVTVPAGTRILVRTNDPLDSRNRAGSIFVSTLETNIQAEGRVVARRGTTVHGRLAEARPAGRRTGSSQLTLELTDIIINGTATPIVTNFFEIRGRGEGASTARNVTRGAGLGALLGVAAGGGRGAAVGTVAGAATGNVLSGRRGEEVLLPAGSLIEFRLSHPVALPR
jgi:hypothetical protein